MRMSLICLALVALPALAADPQPEIQRTVAKAQANGAVHTIRQIPEACVRFEGTFTGQAAQPYRFERVRTSAQCQPRARLLDYAQAKPASTAGWKLNDVIRIPSAVCPSQQAVVKVWRKPVEVAPPALDAQNRSRIYLQDAREDIDAGKVAQAPIPLYAAEMALEGKACGQ